MSRKPLARIGRALVKTGLPALGTAVGGPAGGIVAASIGSLLGVDPADERAVETAIAQASPETLVRLREIEAQVEAARLAADETEQRELTARHGADMASDSWLAKNIRPLVLATTTAVYLLFVVVCAFALPVERADLALSLVSGIGSLLIAQVGFYFGGRSGEKITQCLHR
jgi:hypothetical protein